MISSSGYRETRVKSSPFDGLGSKKQCISAKTPLSGPFGRYGPPRGGLSIEVGHISPKGCLGPFGLSAGPRGGLSIELGPFD